jgi:integrase
MPKYYIPKSDFVIVPKETIQVYMDMAKDLETRILLAITWLTGSRINEVVNLTRVNVNISHENQDVTFIIKAQKHGKIGYPSFSFTDPFVKEVVEYVERCDNKLFTRGKRLYQLRLMELNEQINGQGYTKWITFHYLRHSRLTYIARELRASPEEIKSWTGHRTQAFEDYFAPRKIDRFKGKF